MTRWELPSLLLIFTSVQIYLFNYLSSTELALNSLCKKIILQEFPSWLSGNKSDIHEYAGLTPGLALADTARILRCCGSGLGWQLQLRLDP